MSGREQLSASMRAILARRRESLREPSPEELVSYRDGELGAAEREAMLERIVAFPQAARALLDPEALPRLDPAVGEEVREPAKGDLAPGWAAFRERLEALQSRDSRAGKARGDRRQWPPTGWLLAASLGSLVVGVLLGYELRRPGLMGDRSAVNVPVIELLPATDSAERSAATRLELPPSAEGLVLILDPLLPPEMALHAVEIEDAGGRLVWRRDDLEPTPLGVFQFVLDSRTLVPGRYSIRLSKPDGETAAEVAEFVLSISGARGGR